MGEPPHIAAPPQGVGLNFDVYMWPLVLVTMPPVTGVDDITYLQACYEHVFAAPTRHALIVDTTTIAKVPDAALRRRMKDFEDGKRPIIARKNIGSAIVIQNSIIRGAFTALRWISPQPAPNKAFSEIREAAKWCIRGIEQDGQTPPLAAYILAGLTSAASG